MKDSYLLVGVRPAILFRLLGRNRVSFCPKYICRILFLALNACWAGIFAAVERRKFREKYEKINLPADPVIIIGHWRTGSTFLHQLMSRDPQFCSPTLFQTTIPDSFLISEKYYRPVMSRLMPSERPMDNVKSGFDEPQEEEYATFRMSGVSALERLIFPKSTQYFPEQYEAEGRNSDWDSEEWEKAFVLFCKKLYFISGKPLLLKNPFLSMRIKEVRMVFPQARFIHIYRHPFKVIPSTIRMWEIVSRQNKLNRHQPCFSTRDVAAFFRKMSTTVREEFSFMESSRYSEVRYEDLVADPIHTLKKIYACLDIPFSEEFEKILANMLAEGKTYTANTFRLSQEDKEIIAEELRDYFQTYNYSIS